jgi:surface protein
MVSMFGNCMNLKSLNISGFNTSNVVCMSHLFDGCNSLSELDVSSFDTSNVTQFVATFGSCRSLKELDLSNFQTEKAKDMGHMFNGCTNLTSIKLNFDMSSVTNATAMFGACKKLSSGSIRFYNVPKKKWSTKSAFLKDTWLSNTPIAKKVVVEFV